MQQKILVINSGSSSLKFQLLSMPDESLLASGLIDRIGEPSSQYSLNINGIKSKSEFHVATHLEAFDLVVQGLTKGENVLIHDLNEVDIVGHRIVHGGSKYADAVLINDEVIATINELSSLAPLHNPANLIGVIAAKKVFPHAKHVAVFDTAFHQTIPEKAHRYALPNTFYDDHKIRVYGFHGSSHRYLVDQLRYLRNELPEKIITLHLGNGCSMAAIKNGICIDTSLGFTPAPGLIMGTRAGDIDPGVILYLIDKLGMSPKEVNDLINKKSGMLGLTGHGDLRDIIAESESGEGMASMALEMNTYRIKKYIGAYTAAMDGLDALIFTAGIGENSSKMRSLICSNLDCFGILLDEDKNAKGTSNERTIHASSSKVEIWVIPTQEELEIARESYHLSTEA